MGHIIVDNILPAIERDLRKELLVVTSVYSDSDDLTHARVAVIIAVLAFAHAMSTTCRVGALDVLRDSIKAAL